MIDPKQEALAAIIFIGSVITAIFASPHFAVWLSTQGATP